MGKNNIELLRFAESFKGKGGAIFRSYCGLGPNDPYCCAYITYLFQKGGDSALFYGGKKVVYCPNALSWCRANLAMIPLYMALPSDIIYFDWQPNGVPDHIGLVRERKSCDAIYTIEGNTSGGIVDYKTRPAKYVLGVYRPHFSATFDASKKLVIDGLAGYHTIAVLQRALGVTVDGILGKGTVRALQKRAGTTQDGHWGNGTSRAVQKMLGVTADGLFGPASVKALQTWCNKMVFPQQVTPQDRTIACAKKLIAQGFKYVKYNKNNLRPTNGGNCIRFVGKSLKDAGINVSDSASGLLNNAFADKMLKASASDALAMWKKRNGSNWEIVRNTHGIPETKLKAGDVLIGYNGNSYVHTALKGENGYIYDCCSDQGGAKKRKFSKLGCTPKLAFRYTGK